MGRRRNRNKPKPSPSPCPSRYGDGDGTYTGESGLSPREEVKIYAQAVKQRWPIPPALKLEAVATVWANLSHHDGRVRAHAADTLVKMEAQVQKDELATKHIPTVEQQMGKPLDAKDWLDAFSNTLPVTPPQETEGLT